MKFQILKDQYPLNGEIYAINSVVDLDGEVGARLEMKGDVRVWHGKTPTISKESRKLLDKLPPEVKEKRDYVAPKKEAKASIMSRFKEGVKKK